MSECDWNRERKEFLDKLPAERLRTLVALLSQSIEASASSGHHVASSLLAYGRTFNVTAEEASFISESSAVDLAECLRRKTVYVHA